MAKLLERLEQKLFLLRMEQNESFCPWCSVTVPLKQLFNFKVQSSKFFAFFQESVVLYLENGKGYLKRYALLLKILWKNNVVFLCHSL